MRFIVDLCRHCLLIVCPSICLCTSLQAKNFLEIYRKKHVSSKMITYGEKICYEENQMDDNAKICNSRTNFVFITIILMYYLVVINSVIRKKRTRCRVMNDRIWFLGGIFYTFLSFFDLQLQ